jgi:hypothetical protein
MKKQIGSKWCKQLLFTTIAIVFFFAANSSVVAQTKKFKPGDRVQCHWLQNGNFDHGTIVPFDKTDIDQFGIWYRGKLDKDKIPNSTVECMANRLRPLAIETNSENNSDNEERDD